MFMSEWFMPFTTKRQPLFLSAEDRAKLEELRGSSRAEKQRVIHAAILLDCASGRSDGAVAAATGVNRHTVALCAKKFLQFGTDAALGDLPRPGQSRRILDDAIAWILNWPARNRRIWATPTNCGLTLCFRLIFGSIA